MIDIHVAEEIGRRKYNDKYPSLYRRMINNIEVECSEDLCKNNMKFSNYTKEIYPPKVYILSKYFKCKYANEYIANDLCNDWDNFQNYMLTFKELKGSEYIPFQESSVVNIFYTFYQKRKSIYDKLQSFNNDADKLIALQKMNINQNTHLLIFELMNYIFINDLSPISENFNKYVEIQTYIRLQLKNITDKTRHTNIRCLLKTNNKGIKLIEHIINSSDREDLCNNIVLWCVDSENINKGKMYSKDAYIYNYYLKKPRVELIITEGIIDKYIDTDVKDHLMKRLDDRMDIMMSLTKFIGVNHNTVLAGKFLDIVAELNDIPERYFLDHTTQDIIDKLNETSSPKLLWDILVKLRGKEFMDTECKLHIKRPYLTFKLHKYELYKKRSSFHSQIVDDMYKYYIQRQHLTSQKETMFNKMSCDCGILEQLETFLYKKYLTTDFKNVLLQFSNNDCQEASIEIHKGLQSTVIDEEDVRNPSGYDSTRSITDNILHVIRDFLKPYIGNNFIWDNLTPMSIRGSIPDDDRVKICYDNSIRKHLTPEEIIKLEEEAKLSKSKWVYLMILICKQVALRYYALTHITMNDLYDFKNNIPKHECKILEKNNKYRNFITSKQIKNAIIQLLEKCPEYRDEPNRYIFTNSKKNKAMRSGKLNELLNELARDAGITDIKLHSHMFRYSLGTNLLQEGNDLTTISKYMGHGDVSTTYKHYIRNTAEDICNSIKMPYDENGAVNIPIIESDDGSNSSSSELDEEDLKLLTLVNVIKSYQAIITDNVSNNRSALDIQNRIDTLEREKKLMSIDTIKRMVLDNMSSASTMSYASTL